jgi:hypothetical protein
VLAHTCAHAHPGAAAPAASCKRKSPAAEPAAPEAARAASRRQYEFVRIAPVSAWLRSVFPSKVVEPVQQFCAMVALCGCDFARNLPRLGPRSLWKMRHRLQNSDMSQPTQALCAIAIACAYHDMFVARNTVPPRVTNSVGWFQQASDELALSVYEELASRVARPEGVGGDPQAAVAGGDLARALAQRRVDAAVLERAGARAGPADGRLRLRARQQGQDGLCRGKVM